MQDVPEHGEAVADERQRRGALDGVLKAILRVFESQLSFCLMEGDFQRPTFREMIRAGLPSLRHKPLSRLVLASFHAAKERWATRLVHFSVQSNHVHLLVEADGHRALSRAMQGLATRLAKALNRLLERRGPVFADRYHARALTTPLEVRRALVYVLHNHRRHVIAPGRPSGFDPLSTAPYFDGFAPGIARPPSTTPPEDLPVAQPRTWLLRTGWRRHGLLGARDVPA